MGQGEPGCHFRGTEGQQAGFEVKPEAPGTKFFQQTYSLRPLLQRQSGPLKLTCLETRLGGSAQPSRQHPETLRVTHHPPDHPGLIDSRQEEGALEDPCPALASLMLAQ